MTISPVMRTGINGVQKGLQEMSVTADKIVKATSSGTEGQNSVADLTAEVVNLNLYEKQVSASVKVIKTADENLGTLLDVTG